MTLFSWIYNPIGQLQTVTKNPTRTLVMIRHKFHRCIYLLVIFIFAVVAFFLWSKINYFIKTYLLSPFLVIFRWLWTFFNYMIFIYASKTFTRRAFYTSVVQITSRTRFLVFLSDYFETFFCRMVGTSKKCALCMDKIFSLTVFNKTWAAVNI